MLKIVSGDIFSSGCYALVNPVNTVGVMGAGLAKKFAEKYPSIVPVYKQGCKDGTLRIGKVQPVRTNDVWILNFPTKEDWRYPSKLEYIVSGLESLSIVLRNKYIDSVAIPALGCGLGGLNWLIVREKIRNFSAFHTDVYIKLYEPEYGYR